MQIHYKPTFVRQYNNLEQQIQQEVIEKIELFKDQRNHKRLKVHKLKGLLSGRYGFSVNYRFRIVFTYLSKKEAILMAIGDHDIYK